MARRKLSKTKKAKNKAEYKTIRKEYNKVKEKAPNVSYIQFKHRVQSRSKRDEISIKEAAKKEAKTDTFWKAPERSRDNLVEALKSKHRAAYDELKNLSRSKGKFQSIKGNLVWDQNKNGYVLNSGGKKYFIDVTNSPEDVEIVEMD